MPYILADMTEAIGTITLDHERRRNALSRALGAELMAAPRAFRDAKVRVAILRAKPGCRVWSVGHDVDELPATRRDPLGWDDPLRQLVREIETFPPRRRLARWMAGAALLPPSGHRSDGEPPCPRSAPTAPTSPRSPRPRSRTAGRTRSCG